MLLCLWYGPWVRNKRSLYYKKYHYINWLTRSTASQAHLFHWKISKSANALFRFPTTSGWLLPETTLRFLFLHREDTLLPRHFSPFQRHHYRSLNDISWTCPCNLHALSLFSSFASLFLLGMTVPESNEFWQHDTLPHLRNCTPKLPRSPHPPPCFLCDSSPLGVFAPSTAAYTFRFAYCTVFAVFCVFSFVPCFFACQF